LSFDSSIFSDPAKLKEFTYKLTALNKFITSTEKADKLFRKLRYFSETWDCESKLQKKERLNSEEAIVVHLVIDANEIENIPFISDLSKRVKELRNRFQTIDPPQEGDLIFYSYKQKDYMTKMRGASPLDDFWNYVKLLYKTYILRWTYHHAGIIQAPLNSNQFRVAHITPKGYVSNTLSNDKLTYTEKYRLQIKKLIPNSLDVEQEKKLNRIFYSEMNRLLSTDFNGIKLTYPYSLKNLNGLALNHRSEIKNNYDKLTLPDLKKKNTTQDEKETRSMCSELVAYGIILALQKVKKECESMGLEMRYPFDEHEILENLDPDRLFNLLNCQELLVRVDSSFQKIFSF
jgi:hypothetical protein